MPRFRKCAKDRANTAALFDAVGAVTFNCLVVVKVTPALRNRKRRPLERRRHRVR
jgi:hypothetical protein